MKGKENQDFNDVFTANVDREIITPIFKASSGLVQITSLSQVMKDHAVSRESIGKSEELTGYVVKIEDGKVFLSLAEPELDLNTDLRFINVKPSFISRILLGFWTAGISTGYMISEEEKKEYLDRFQDVRNGKSITISKTTLKGTGIAGVIVSVIAFLGFLYPKLYSLPFLDNYSVYFAVIVLAASLTTLELAYRESDISYVFKTLKNLTGRARLNTKWQ